MRITGRARSNFTPAFRFLDREQRRAMTAVYAFCRVVDDIVDGNLAPDIKREQLRGWRERLATGVRLKSDTCEGLPPLMHELAWAMTTFGIPSRYLEELIDGVARDIEARPIQTYTELLQYCYGVAGTVGLICLAIFRIEETPKTRSAALALANAFQITNILRDILEDIAAGRCYLPREDLDRFGVTFEQLRAGEPTAQLGLLIAFEAEHAERFFNDAWADFSPDDKRLRCARMMSSYYHTLLRQIWRDPLRVLHGRVRVPWWTKIKLICRQS